MIRLEKKFVLNNHGEKFKFIKYLYKKGFSNIFQDRYNFSIYFDFKNLKYFVDSEEGFSYRTKVRLRTEKDKLINNYKMFNFEIKKSNPNFKKKYSFQYKEGEKQSYNDKIIYEKNLIESNIFSKKLLPILSTDYKRSYFFSEYYGRITIDTDLEYQVVSWKEDFKNFNFLRKKKDRRIIVEHKLENNVPIKNFITLVPIRFSKYCEGVKALKLI